MNVRMKSVQTKERQVHPDVKSVVININQNNMNDAERKEFVARELLEGKRKSELTLAKGIRKMLGIGRGAAIKDTETFFQMSGEIMRIYEEVMTITR